MVAISKDESSRRWRRLAKLRTISSDLAMLHPLAIGVAAIIGDDGDIAGEHDAWRLSKSGLESKFHVEVPFVSRGDGDDKRRRWGREPRRGEVDSESEKTATGMASEMTDDDG
ncbi:hypothetical protein TIFTF001_030174 [Ficus carica]|uniref:Uncharacterized protein n=1 Tax=Ficus carica TaxID=3494 RepID=A0AA88DSR8_FICCA|nr:hypothetical protein TIFTF001_030174 [Ficus carica]